MWHSFGLHFGTDAGGFLAVNERQRHKKRESWTIQGYWHLPRGRGYNGIVVARYRRPVVLPLADEGSCHEWDRVGDAG